MSNRAAVRLASLVALLAVVLGAFGAHALKETLVRNGTVSIWERATFYHMAHALMLFILIRRERALSAPWFFFLGGIVLFSGSLYVLAASNWRWLRAIAPFGGVSFIIGWVCLLICPGTFLTEPNSIAPKP